ncbi:TPA: hypothetical protein ACH3X1_010216 [Trebouxia sp. C0004]
MAVILTLDMHVDAFQCIALLYTTLEEEEDCTSSANQLGCTDVSRLSVPGQKHQCLLDCMLLPVSRAFHRAMCPWERVPEVQSIKETGFQFTFRGTAKKKTTYTCKPCSL